MTGNADLVIAPDRRQIPPLMPSPPPAAQVVPDSTHIPHSSVVLAPPSPSAQGAFPTLDSTQLLTLLRHLPGVFNKLTEQGNLKEGFKDAETVSAFTHYAKLTGEAGRSRPLAEELYHTDEGDAEISDQDSPKANKKRRMEHGTDEWSRQRKDNHKEVERRRRGNINEGINELARIVPNGSGEKAKGAILTRAVQYIHHLKDNEARNIEKWTLEKLLMDQAMGDLQTQLEDARRMWNDERSAREMAEKELSRLREDFAHRPPGNQGDETSTKSGNE